MNPSDGMQKISNTWMNLIDIDAEQYCEHEGVLE